MSCAKVASVCSVAPLDLISFANCVTKRGAIQIVPRREVTGFRRVHSRPEHEQRVTSRSSAQVVSPSRQSDACELCTCRKERRWKPTWNKRWISSGDKCPWATAPCAGAPPRRPSIVAQERRSGVLRTGKRRFVTEDVEVSKILKTLAATS